MNKPNFANPHADRGNVSIIWFASIFALVTYAAVSTRAILNPFEVHNFIDAKRLISVLIGALILWLSIRAVERQPQKGLAQVIAVLNIAIPGAIGLLLAREAYDLAASGEFAQRAALNLRWMLTWIGYFAAAIATFLALSYHRQLQALTAPATDGHSVDAAARQQSAPSMQSHYDVADIDFDPRKQG